jgi:hypothetical protein
MIKAADKDTCPLLRFVEQITNGDAANRSLTVNDLAVGIRHERLSELSDWSNCELDAIELHAAQFTGESSLHSVLELPFDRYPANKDRLVSNICAPSPFAWT